MRVEYFLSGLADELYELQLSSSQYELITMILSDLRSSLPKEIDEKKGPILSSIVKDHIIYSQDKPSITLYEKLVAELNRTTLQVHTMQPTSLLCALYYLNDLIAVSSAMGIGTEESIYPNDKHIEVICRFLRSIDVRTEEAFLLIQHCRAGRVSQDAHIVPLIIDIIEISYARLGSWKAEDRHKKQLNVDQFYKGGAECCMAKGTLLILRSLQQLPDDLLSMLLGIPLDVNLMKELQDCSNEAIRVITEESLERRYRGGNSATTWLRLRRAIEIEPIRLSVMPTSATSVAGFFSPISPKQQSEFSESNEEAFSL